MVQGVKVVNPMMGGEFDTPIADDDELNETLTPRKEAQTVLGEAGEAAVQVCTAKSCSLSPTLSRRPYASAVVAHLPLPTINAGVLSGALGNVKGAPLDPGIRYAHFRADGTFLAVRRDQRHPNHNEAPSVWH
jgi:hypothetical protein